MDFKGKGSAEFAGNRHVMSWIIMALLAGLFLSSCEQTTAVGNVQEQDVLAVLKRFQSGYSRRDVSRVDEYVRDLFDDQDVLIIGTNASIPNDGEWCEGIDAVKRLVETDWKSWGDLKMETEKARIRIDGGTAWVALTGVLEKSQTRESGYREGMKLVRDRQAQMKYREDPREYFLWLSNYASRLIWDFEQAGGEDFIHPIRMTAVLSNKNGKWLFKQMSFSYPSGFHKMRITRTSPNALSTTN